MTTGGNIELDYDTATAAAAELKERASAVEKLAAQFQAAVEKFQVDAQLDADVMPASRATLDLLTQQAATVRAVIGEITYSIDHASNALNGRVTDSRATEAESVSVIDGIGALNSGGGEGTAR